LSAIFGVIGAATPTELAAMGERLAHRGATARSEEVAPGMHLGVVSDDAGEIHRQDGVTAVVDASPAGVHAGAGRRLFEAFLREGVRGLERSPGTFAVAAWDERSGTLALARDFVGVQPLHWCALPGGGVAFATEYKALLALERVPAVADLDAVQYLQERKTTPPGRTLLRDVHAVPPGAVLSLDRAGRVVGRADMQEVRLEVREQDEGTARAELARHYVDALRPLVEGRRRVGISLSGGIDSLSIAFVARRCAPDAELVGFTAGYGPGDPEIVTAARAMRTLGGRHEPVIVSAERLHELLPATVWHLEDPVGRTETVQMLEIGRAASAAGLDRLLSGMGSDALFAGMPKHKVLWLSQHLPPLRRDLQEFYELTQSGRKPGRPLARLMDLVYFRGRVPPVPAIRGAGKLPTGAPLPAPDAEFLNRVLVAGVHEALSRSLVRLERPLAAFGVGLASPFFDRALMQHAFTLPAGLKIRRGREKYVLREALRSIVPPDLLNVPKGIARLRHDREFAQALLSLADRWLTAPACERRGWFAADDVRRIRASLGRGRYHPEAAMRLWTLVGTEIWARRFLDARGAPPAP
jgi:asparagine synthase (glutamine-hydrolysing)